MSHYLVYFLVSAFCIQCSLQAQTVWNPVIVSNSSLQNTTLITEQANALVDVSCSIIATRRPWAKLFCIVGEHCIISSFLAVPYPSQVPIADPVECMTNVNGCHIDGSTTVPLGAWNCLPPFYDSNGPYQCVKGIMMPAAHPPPKINCPSTFTNGQFGCVFSIRSTAQHCNARKACLEMESDLYMFDQMTSPADLKSFMDAVIPSTYIHAGFIGNATNYKWFNGNVFLRNSTLSFYNFEPFGPINSNSSCGIVAPAYNYSSYGLASTSCNERYFETVCQIEIAN